MYVIIGAKGLAKQIYPHIKDRRDIVFFDEDSTIKTLYEYPVINEIEFIENWLKSGFDVYFLIAIGNPKYRRLFSKKLLSINAIPASITSETSIIREKTLIGEENIILDYTLIESGVTLGNSNLINCYAGIFHDSVIGDYNEIQPGAKILGNVSIGNGCIIGTNSVILPGISICDDVTIGAGCVVTKNITEPGTYVGIPFNKIK